jgi:hypothetical protein
MFAVVGGTGAFFGVRDQEGGRNSALSGAVSPRLASIAQDPANRRLNGLVGGGGMAIVFGGSREYAVLHQKEGGI